MNPFISQESFELKLLEIKKTSYKIDTSSIPKDGIIVGDYETVTRSFLVEQQKKTSLYYIPYMNNILYKELTSRSRDLLYYIAYNLPEDQDFMNMKHSIVCRNMAISKPTLIAALRELSEVAIICRKSQSEYWINPHFIFSGSRVNFFKEHYPNKIKIVNKS